MTMPQVQYTPRPVGVMTRDLHWFITELCGLSMEVTARLDGAKSVEDVEQVRRFVFGRKVGRLTDIMAHLPACNPATKREAGEVIDKWRSELEADMDFRSRELEDVS